MIRHAVEAGSGGAAITVGPYSCTKPCKMRSSLSALVERGLQLVAHLGGRLAADVVAFEQDLAASAGTHHAMAEVF